MKKSLTSVLVLALVASMGVTAFAATNDGTAGTDITVNGTYKAADAPAEKISVDLVWDNMNFTYTEGSKGTWQPDTHTYEGATISRWLPTSGLNPKITVTNHSNLDIQASFAFNSDIQELNGGFTSETLALDTAEGTEVANAPTYETSFYVYGSGIDSARRLGLITVTVGKYDATPQMIFTAEELLTTEDKVGVFKLANDIDLGSRRLSISSNRYVLDLNGHTLSSSCRYEFVEAGFNRNVTIKNGSVINTNVDADGVAIQVNDSSKLTLEKCVVTSYAQALFLCPNTTTCVTDCKLNTTKESRSTILNTGTLTFSGNVEILSGHGISNQGGTVTALAGTYNFDPTNYVNQDNFSITNDTEADTWTVTAK